VILLNAKCSHRIQNNQGFLSFLFGVHPMRPSGPFKIFFERGAQEPPGGAKLAAFQAYRAHIYGRFGMRITRIKL